MACKELLSKLSDYIDQDLNPEFCDKIESHMKSCPPCQAFINTFRKTVELLQKRSRTIKKQKKKLN